MLSILQLEPAAELVNIDLYYNNKVELYSCEFPGFFSKSKITP